MESVSIEQDMADRSKYGRTLIVTQCIIGATYMLFGVVVYFFFGAATGRTCGDSADGSLGGGMYGSMEDASGGGAAAAAGAGGAVGEQCPGGHWLDKTIFQNVPPGACDSDGDMTMSLLWSFGPAQQPQLARLWPKESQHWLHKTIMTIMQCIVRVHHALHCHCHCRGVVHDD
eukprot:SAG22_NODE_1785_length_3588_cov_10.712525_2_plen_173_part_00